MIPKEDLVCFRCKHLTPEGCRAFPEGIPDVIISGENDHSKPLPGQENGITFEPNNEQQN